MLVVVSDFGGCMSWGALSVTSCMLAGAAEAERSMPPRSACAVLDIVGTGGDGIGCAINSLYVDQPACASAALGLLVAALARLTVLLQPAAATLVT